MLLMALRLAEGDVHPVLTGKSSVVVMIQRDIIYLYDPVIFTVPEACRDTFGML